MGWDDDGPSYQADESEGICAVHFEEAYLRGKVRAEAALDSCVLCGQLDGQKAAPLSELLGTFMQGLTAVFEDAANFLPYCSAEGGYQGATYDIPDIIDHFADDFADEDARELFRDRITDDTVWAIPWGGQREWLNEGWDEFVRVACHVNRFWLAHHKVAGFGSSAEALLRTVGDTACRLGRVVDVPRTQCLYRIRPGSGGWDTESDLGAPPEALSTSANRMSSPGVSAFYCALEEETAVAEVVATGEYTLGVWQPMRTLRVLDLCSAVQVPSIYDPAVRDERPVRLFMRDFQAEISKSVGPGESQRIEYVPTQIVSDFFRLVFQLEGRGLDGLIYGSSRRPSGRNLILFSAGQFWRAGEDPTYMGLRLAGAHHH